MRGCYTMAQDIRKNIFIRPKCCGHIILIMLVLLSFFLFHVGIQDFLSPNALGCGGSSTDSLSAN
jgi:hypothetical protein